jgi:hypothetical protein
MKKTTDSSTLFKLAKPLTEHALPPQFDLAFENHYSIVLIRRLSKSGQQWLDDNVGDDETQYFGNAVACEPRYVEPIWEGAITAALQVSR